MAFMDTHEAYQKHKDDPLVKMLLEFFRNGSGVKIPEVWRSFIMKSSEHTDINLLLSQLHNWGINEEIDATLRGPELLDHIMSFRLRLVFRSADSIATNKEMPWPLALEEAFIQKGYIQTPQKRKLTANGKVLFNCNLKYVETGTVTYKVHRSIPEVFCLIPPEWILDNCSPDVSDEEIMSRFMTWMQNGFAPIDVQRNGGFEFKMWLKKVLSNNDRGRWDVTKLVSRLSGFFPKRIQGQQFDDESMFEMELIKHVPTPLSTDNDVNNRHVKLELRRDRRGAPRPTHFQFPVFSYAEQDDMENQGVRVPPVHTIHNGVIHDYYTDPRSESGLEQKDYMVSAFRRTYEELRKSLAYDKLRREALNG